MSRLVKSTVALVTSILAIAGTAAAQPGMTAPPPTLPSRPATAEPGPAEPTQPELGQAKPGPNPTGPGQSDPRAGQLPDGERSEGVALGLSVGGTVASWAMIAVPVAVNHPDNHALATLAWTGALGVVFAPSFGHWYAGRFATRGLGLRLAGAGFATLALLSFIAICEDECTPTIPQALLVAGVGFAIAGTIDDIATAPRAVRRYNQRQHSASIVPVIRRDNSSVGFAITGQF